MPSAGLVAGALALTTLALVGGCVSPPTAAEVAETGFRTPAETFRSFQVFLAADLELWEYRSFSSHFRRKHGLTAINYAEARDQLFRERPWLKLIAKAEIAREWSDRDQEGVHFIEARVAGRTVHVKLVREDSYEIYSGDRYVSDGYANFDDLIRVEDTSEGPRLTVIVTPYEPEIDLSEATSVLLQRTWHIDDLIEAPQEP